MKTFIANKINILLTFLLIAMLGVTGFFAYTMIRSSAKVVVPDFLGKNKEEAVEWCGQLDEKYSCEFVYEPSSSVEKDHIFQQSLNSGSILKDKLIIRVSSELVKPIELPSLNNAKKQDIENWQRENGIVNLTFKEENSDTVAKGNVIRIEPAENISKDTPVTVYISLGKEGAENEQIEIKSGEYVNLTVSRFEEQVKSFGLVPNHDTSRDAKSESVAKGNVVWHGSGTYEKGETINYGVCLEESKGSDKDEIVIKSGTYVGDSEEDFRSTAENLGLKPNHNSDKDAYSDTVAKGRIVWHGSGTYVKNETFNYGLSLGKKDSSGGDSDEIYVSKNQYVGKTESEFKQIASDLGLKAVHLSDRAAYSDTVAKGSIVTHGYGTYEKNENFNYGLSLGKKDSSGGDSDKIVISSGTYIGKSESEFRSTAESLGLRPYHNTDKDDYSDTVAEGCIVWHGSGTYVKGEDFNYGVSLGKRQTETGQIMRPEKYQVGDTFDSTKQKMQSYLSVFTNVEYIGVSSTKGVGRLEMIEVGSYGSGYSAGSYPIDTPIKVYIVNKQTN